MKGATVDKDKLREIRGRGATSSKRLRSVEIGTSLPASKSFRPSHVARLEKRDVDGQIPKTSASMNKLVSHIAEPQHEATNATSEGNVSLPAFKCRQTVVDKTEQHGQCTKTSKTSNSVANHGNLCEKGGLRTGLPVLIIGLKGAVELNGQTGICESFDARSGRWHVRLASGVVKALKVDNLRPLRDLKMGSTVRIHSFEAAPMLNGSVGVCKSWDGVSSRWHVKMQNGVTRAMKSDNLTQILDVDSTERALLKKRAFTKCDKDCDGYLNEEEMILLAKASGADTSADAWRLITYMQFCISCSANLVQGIPEKGVFDLLDDLSEEGCYCSNDQLKELLDSS